MLNLLVAVEQPSGIERVILDGAVVLLIAWFATTMATTSTRTRLDRRRLGGVGTQSTSAQLGDASEEGVRPRLGPSPNQNFRRMLTNLIGQKSPIGGRRPAVRWIGWK